MFWKRAVSCIVLIPIVIFAVQWSEPHLYFALVIGVTCLMLVEFCRLSKLIGLGQIRIAIVASGILFCASALIERLSVEFVLSFTLFFAFAIQIFHRQVNRAFIAVTSILTAAVYIGWMFGHHLILLRKLSDSAGKSVGSELVLFLLVVIWCGDTAAYILGRWLGKHKLIPEISPRKTVEGTIAGLCIGALGGLGIWFLLLKEMLNLAHALGLGILLGTVSQIGDLSESIIKRTANVKDSGTLIPGHGGFLDRCDSLIFAAPTLYYYFQYVINA